MIASKVKIIVAIIAVLSVLGALKLYGDAKRNQGKQTEQAAQNSANIDGLKENAKIWKDVQHETRNNSHDDNIRVGERLGILRPDTAY